MCTCVHPAPFGLERDADVGAAALAAGLDSAAREPAAEFLGGDGLVVVRMGPALVGVAQLQLGYPGFGREVASLVEERSERVLPSPVVAGGFDDGDGLAEPVALPCGAPVDGPAQDAGELGLRAWPAGRGLRGPRS